MRPAPIPPRVWDALNVPFLNVAGASVDLLYECCSGFENLPQRAKAPSAGGDVQVVSPRSSSPVLVGPLLSFSGLHQRLARIKRGRPVRVRQKSVWVRLLFCCSYLNPWASSFQLPPPLPPPRC